MDLNKLFIEAVKLGILPVAKQLVEAGANVRAYDDYALRYAAEKGHTAIADYLKSEIAKLENKAKV